MKYSELLEFVFNAYFQDRSTTATMYDIKTARQRATGPNDRPRQRGAVAIKSQLETKCVSFWDGLGSGWARAKVRDDIIN
jgi:hypothetical protein